MTRRRTFTAQFKAQVVLDILSGQKSAAEICRDHQLKPQVVSGWKTDFVTHAAQVFAQAETRSQEQQRIAELERLVGRQALELEILKKATPACGERGNQTGAGTTTEGCVSGGVVVRHVGVAAQHACQTKR